MRFPPLHLCQDLNQEQSLNSNDVLLGKRVLINGRFYQLFQESPKCKNGLSYFTRVTLHIPQRRIGIGKRPENPSGFFQVALGKFIHISVSF